MSKLAQDMRFIEALLFAAPAPMPEKEIAERLPDGADLAAALEALSDHYRGRGVNLVQTGSGWAFRTAADLAGKLKLEIVEPRKLPRVALETLAIIAYHQPVTRAEIEQIRGVATSRGTLDTLMEADWVRPGRRRQTPGRPVTWVTTPAFLDHFQLASLDDLPGVAELKAAGLLEAGPSIAKLPGGRILDGGAEADEDDRIDDTDDDRDL